jgi:hypothetical protein
VGHGLSQSFVDPALAFLAARGATIRFGEVLEVGFIGSRAVVLDFESGALTLGDDAAAVIAVPPLIARELLPGLETPDTFRAIVNAHFHVSPPTGQPAILGVVNGLIECLFAYPHRRLRRGIA